MSTTGFTGEVNYELRGAEDASKALYIGNKKGRITKTLSRKMLEIAQQSGDVNEVKLHLYYLVARNDGFQGEQTQLNYLLERLGDVFKTNDVRKVRDYLKGVVMYVYIHDKTAESQSGSLVKQMLFQRKEGVRE